MRYLSALAGGSGAEIRQEILKGKSYLVVPVVAMVGDIVVHPANAEHPEFVPAEVLKESLISGWNNRPVVMSHPKKKGIYVSAGDSPEIVESYQYGFLLNTVFDSNRLKCEMWLDEAEAESLGGDAQEAITKLKAGETIDVSIGAIVVDREESGTTSNGDEYLSVWESVYSDHLATLPNKEGACNQSAGCGAPRVMESKKEDSSVKLKVSADIAPENANKSPLLTKIQRFMAKFKPNIVFDDGDSQNDLRQDLTAALKVVEPGLDWICDFWPDKGVVVYSTYVIYASNGYNGTYQYWRRTYTTGSNGVITFNNDAVQVEPKQVWETVDPSVGEITASEGKEAGIILNETKTETLAAPCQCKGDTNMDRKELVSNLIRTLSGDSASGVKVSPEGIKEISGLSDAALVALNAIVPKETPAPAVETPKPETVVTPPVVSSANSSTTVSITPEELASLRAAASKLKIQEAAQHKALVSAILPVQKRFTLEQLSAKSLSELEDIASLLSLDKPAVDFSIMGLPESPVRAAEMRELPDTWGLRAASQKQAN